MKFDTTMKGYFLLGLVFSIFMGVIGFLMLLINAAITLGAVALVPGIWGLIVALVIVFIVGLIVFGFALQWFVRKFKVGA